MKKIINGKSYNTETSTLIASWDNRLGYSDFRHCAESMYKTKKGVWFISGKGGAMSSWSVSNGNATYGATGIRVLS